ncbi:MAG: AAA family ATPase [Chloroflexi bacterium]|nr:AAA family ATPase [Chloroflexota bacterium]
METLAKSAREIDEALRRKFEAEDPKARIQVWRGPFGSLRLLVVSRAFDGLEPEEREARINIVLSGLGFELYTLPVGSYELLSPSEVDEQAIAARWSEPPLWSEILTAPATETNGRPRKPRSSSTKTVTFYSFKGGVGRSTALALVALALARVGRRVVALDLDLEAPGLASLFNLSQTDTGLGALDYLHRRWLSPNSRTPSIKDCLHQVSVPEAKGKLWVIPAGAYDEDYIHRLADLDMAAMYRRDPNPLHQMIDDLADRLKPDVILLDARTGFNDLSAVTLLDLADLALVFFTPSEQSYRGLKWVVTAVRKQYQRHSRPDLRFVLSPLPPSSIDSLNRWLADAESWIAEEWGKSEETPLRYEIRYNAFVPFIRDLTRDVSPEVAISYEPLAEAVSLGSFPQPLDKKVRFTVSGKKFEFSGREVIKKLRNVMASGLPRRATDVRVWAVEIDGQRVSLTWLFEMLTGLRLYKEEFDPRHAQKKFEQMGLRIVRVGG